ncbi:MAG: biopolymer transporter ExbD [Spirochaetia bacterium]|nr:biopolymer transporter ExbD [Spirochaetia bacterium]MCF7941183.1 biopolymer transporter ExbD [Spirochaetia bacterium]
MIDLSSRKARRRPSLIGDLTPMIDMIFLLLIFFLLTSLAVDPAVDIELPASSTGRVTGQQLQQVQVLSARSYRYDRSVYTREALEELLQLQLEQGELSRAEPLYIQADRSIPYGDLITALEPFYAAGFVRISFVIEQVP